MADMSYIQKEDLDDSDEAMEIGDTDNDTIHLHTNPRNPEICNIGPGCGDDGKDDQLEELHQYLPPDMNFKRQGVGKMLVQIFRIAASNGTKLNISEIMQKVHQIVAFPGVQIRTDLLEQIPEVATICHEYPHLFDNVLHDYLLNFVIMFLQDRDNQIRMSAQAAVLALTKRGLLDNNTIEMKLCPQIEMLCRSVDFINCGISVPEKRKFDCSSHQSGCDVLMCKLAPFMGKDLAEKIFLDKYIALCEDEVFYTRKICASHFGEFCAAVRRKTLFHKLFPIYINLWYDKVWGVRKACVDVMMAVSCCMTLQHRQLLLAELLATHLNDESKWVRMSAFQILGPFISTFAKQFTEVTYNHHGELVFTSQQDTRFSIRYLYEGIFPAKCTIQSHMLDAEDYNSKDIFDSSVIIEKPICEQEEDDDDEDEPQDYIFTMKAYRTKIQWKHLQNNEDDTENFNSFLYYYVSPDLPRDDVLVESAKRSAAKRFAARRFRDRRSAARNIVDQNLFANIASGKASSLEDVSEGSKYPNSFEAGHEQDVVPQYLIDSFLLMARPKEYFDMGTDLPHYCAFSFAAVVLTLGREKWPYLKPAYQSLASANQWKVRRTLASSIHEIANILGEELTATDLVPIYDGFIKDLDEVRIGVLKHLATFLKMLRPVYRRQYLPRLKEFLTTDTESNWRFREELATQLLEIVNLFSPADVERHIVSLSLDLLNDKVAAVRHVALSLVTQIVAHLSVNECLVTTLFQELRFFLGVYAKKWIRRQTFALVCAKLISSNAISGDRFSQEMLPNLLKLSSDKIPNVRLAVARTLSKNVVPMGSEWLGVEQAEEVERMLREMRSDPDRDVRVLAGGEENSVLDILPQTKAK